jgi:hypothetical protein
MTTFWLYERSTTLCDPTMVHAGWCRSCNEGRGFSECFLNRRINAERPFGQWHGPYLDLEHAVLAAKMINNDSAKRTKLCGHCIDVNSANPLRRRTPTKRSTAQAVIFSLQLARDGSVTPHANACPCLPSVVVSKNSEGNGTQIVVVKEDIWYTPYNRLSNALSKADQVISADPRRRMRHCRACARSGRLIRLDDLRAVPFARDAHDAAIMTANAAVSAKRIVCLECGRSRIRLRTHLQQAHQLTPEQYRERWKLPADFSIIPQGFRRQLPRRAVGPAEGVRDLSDDDTLERAAS